MSVQSIDFQVPLVSKVKSNTRFPRKLPELSLRVFYEDNLPTVKGIVPFFAEASSTGPFNTTHMLPVTFLQRGYVFVQVIPLASSQYPLNVNESPYSPHSDNAAFSYEVETAIDWIINVFRTGSYVQGLSSTTPVLVTGSGRGAVAVLHWSGAADSFNLTSKAVTKFCINSPSNGGSVAGKWNDAPQVTRAHFEAIQRAKHRGRITYARNDRNYSNRSMTEKISLNKTNDLVDLHIPPVDNYDSSWVTNYPTAFANIALDFFEGT